eukprot:7811293-Pyramimonas_sp.AAC.1
MQRPWNDDGRYMCGHCRAVRAGFGYFLHCPVAVEYALKVGANYFQRPAEQALCAAWAPLGPQPLLVETLLGNAGSKISN